MLGGGLADPRTFRQRGIIQQLPLPAGNRLKKAIEGFCVGDLREVTDITLEVRLDIGTVKGRQLLVAKFFRLGKLPRQMRK